MDNMKLILFCVLTILSAVRAQQYFGTSSLQTYLKNSEACNQWICISGKFNLPDEPPREQLRQVLNNLLPPGAWQDALPKFLDSCYGEKAKSCPGQALLQCVVDQFIQNCPDDRWRKNDACAPLKSLVGLKYMFSQSRYEGLEINLPKDKRSPWFVKNHFYSKCCDLPEIFNATVLSECGFDAFMHYNIHPQGSATKSTSKRYVQNVEIVDFIYTNTTNQPHSTTEKEENNSIMNPLECCDLSPYIDPSWASECGLEMSWDDTEGFDFNNVTVPVSVTETSAMEMKHMIHDVKVLPLSCEQETCIFRAANIITESGTVDLDAFSKLLENLTNAHPSWVKAKGRVITKCLTKPLVNYVDKCDINRLLACTFDVLSELVHQECNALSAIIRTLPLMQPLETSSVMY